MSRLFKKENIQRCFLSNNWSSIIIITIIIINFCSGAKRDRLQSMYSAYERSYRKILFPKFWRLNQFC